MKLKALSMLILIALGAFSPVFAFPLKTGDILLQSVPCYLCSLIEIEENTPYSHLGIAIVEENRISILESWQKVERISLDEFLAKRKKGTETLVLRPRAFETANARVSAQSFLNAFDRWFAGKHYDDDFLWNNSDELGEKYYCSEFVAKFMNHFLPVSMPTKPMHFQKHRDLWIKYFRGNPPDGQPGVSPGDFERSPLFRNVGFLTLS